MELFEYVAVLTSIIIGLGMARLLSGLTRLIQHPEHAKPYWIHLCWVAYMFVYAVFWWWWEFEGTKFPQDSQGGFGGGRSPPQRGGAAIGGSGGRSPPELQRGLGGRSPPNGPGPRPMGPMGLGPWAHGPNGPNRPMI